MLNVILKTKHGHCNQKKGSHLTEKKKDPQKKTVTKKKTGVKGKVKPQKKFVSKYPSTKYHPGLCDEIEEIFEQGDALAHFCAKHNISYQTFYNWRNKYPELEEAYKKCKPKGEKVWANMGKKHITHSAQGTQLNSIVWSMNMRNRFGWTEHRAVTIPGLEKAKSFDDKFAVVLKQLENGKLTSTEMTAVSGVLSTGVKIAESTQLMERIEKLEAMLEQKQQDETTN